MRQVQTVDIINDAKLAFSGHEVLLPIAVGSDIYDPNDATVESIVMKSIDLNNGSKETATGINMTYHKDVGCWTIEISALNSDFFVRGHKYMSSVSSQDGNFRDFKILEFVIDDRSIESVLAEMAYEIVIVSGAAYMLWHEDENTLSLTVNERIANASYKANAYQNGSGNTYATRPENVTHRGAIVRNS